MCYLIHRASYTSQLKLDAVNCFVKFDLNWFRFHIKCRIQTKGCEKMDNSYLVKTKFCTDWDTNGYNIYIYIYISTETNP